MKKLLLGILCVTGMTLAPVTQADSHEGSSIAQAKQVAAVSAQLSLDAAALAHAATQSERHELAIRAARVSQLAKNVAVVAVLLSNQGMELNTQAKRSLYLHHMYLQQRASLVNQIWGELADWERSTMATAFRNFQERILALSEAVRKCTATSQVPSKEQEQPMQELPESKGVEQQVELPEQKQSMEQEKTVEQGQADEVQVIEQAQSKVQEQPLQESPVQESPESKGVEQQVELPEQKEAVEQEKGIEQEKMTEQNAEFPERKQTVEQEKEIEQVQSKVQEQPVQEQPVQESPVQLPESKGVEQQIELPEQKQAVEQEKVIEQGETEEVEQTEEKLGEEQIEQEEVQPERKQIEQEEVQPERKQIEQQPVQG